MLIYIRCANFTKLRCIWSFEANVKTNKKALADDVATKEDIEEDVAQATMQAKRMKIQPPHDPKPRTDLGGTSGKNPLRDGLIRPAHEFAKSVTETSSKVREPCCRMHAPRRCCATATGVAEMTVRIITT